MGFSSLADFVSEVITNAKSCRTEWNKATLPTTNYVAGEWYDLFGGAGNPTASTIFGTGTNLKFQSLSDTTANAFGIQHGLNVSTDTKHLIRAAMHSTVATVFPSVMMLVDLLGFYPITTVTTTGDQALDNTVTLPRYTNGQGVMAYLTPSTVMGAATPDIRLTYTNQAGAGGQLVPGTLPSGKTASPVGHISYSGVAGAGKYGPFFPLAQADYGIRAVTQFNLSVSYVSGVLNLVLCRPLALFDLTTASVAGDRDYVSQFLSFPRIFDGACLSWLYYAGANTVTSSQIYGSLEFGWG